MQQQQATVTEFKDTRPNAKLEKGLRCKVRLECITGAQVIPGYEVPLGVHEVTINRRHVEQISEHMLETELDTWASAQRQAATTKERMREEAARNTVGRDREHVLEAFEQTYTDSPQATFRRMTGRDLKPFVSMTVLEDNLPELVDEEKLATETAHAVALSKAVGQAVAQAMAPVLASIQSQAQQRRG